MNEVFPRGYQLGIGGVGGFVVGYATKKLSKLIAIIVGLALIGLIYLNVKSVISINYDALWKGSVQRHERSWLSPFMVRKRDIAFALLVASQLVFCSGSR